MSANGIITAAVAPLVTKLVAFFSTPAAGAASKAKEKIEVKFRRGFSRYFEEQHARFATVKTIISSSAPIPLLDIYVNLHLSRGAGHRSCRDEDFLLRIDEYRGAIFTATAGAGKSMLMRYLFLRFLEVQDDRLPVFIELRDINQHPSRKILEHVRRKIEDYIPGFSMHRLRYAMESGRIILFLDGFDEIDHDKRQVRGKEINELALRYKDVWIFASSRPSDEFASWEKFHVFDVRPFSADQVSLLISKLPYDEAVKKLFDRKMAEGLYETHREFLANPLLTIMMLITLEQFAEVPAKIHLFYEYAFEALFGRHDATKVGFQRKRHTSLALDDFKRLFSYFCMITYIRDQRVFSRDRALEAIQQSIKSSQIDVGKEEFLRDLVETACVLVPDGLDLTFSHRSFQEYFAAYFLSRVKAEELERALPNILRRSAFDSVLKMISEMNNEKFEEVWALPTLQNLCERVKGLDAKKDCINYVMRLLGGKIQLGVISRKRFSLSLFEREGSEGSEEWDQAIHRSALYHVYGLFDRIRKTTEKGADELIIKQITDGHILADDPRFAFMREGGRKRSEDGKPLVLRKSDASWFCDTETAAFIAAESKFLPKFRDEMQRRVRERRKGLSSIFMD